MPRLGSALSKNLKESSLPLEPQSSSSKKLHRNEYHFEHAQSVKEATCSSNDLSKYALPALRESFEKSLAQFLEIEVKNLWLGHGAEDLLLKILMLKRLETSLLVLPDLTWAEYSRMAGGLGYDIVKASALSLENESANSNLVSNSASLSVSNEKLEIDLDALEATLQKMNQPCLVILPTTNNPTGSKLSYEKISAFVEKFPRSFFILDAVYEPLPSHFFNAFQKYSNVWVVGSFSKFFGLPGLRLGFCSGSLPASFGLSLGHSQWQFLVAAAALREHSHYSKARLEMLEIAHSLEEMQFKNLKVYPSEAPFVLVRCELPYFLKSTTSILGESTSLISEKLATLIWQAEEVSNVWPKVFAHKNAVYLRFGLGSDPIKSNVKSFLLSLDAALNAL
jgi:histidinol-phosphate/aromatic aminotransferase/cobyric acid decarboxylase-like protein